MTKEEIQQIADTITVITPFKDKVSGTKRWAVKPQVDPFTQSCIWKECVKGQEAFIEEDLGVFNAEHTFRHPSLFKPSLSEVIQAAPSDKLGKFNAVHVIYSGFSNDGKCHTSVVHIYKIRIGYAHD